MKKALNLTTLIAGLGYFVDMFDLTIFGVVRSSSLGELLPGASSAQLMSTGILLVNLQAAGMLIGGLIWGVIGDKKGRLSVLFGSIVMYSLANFLNAWAADISTYACLRFIAGVGLAGELGAAVTLVSESLSAEDRGYGTTIIASLGLGGAVAASLIGQFLSWRSAYIIGGTMGALLLFARFNLVDSGLFDKAKQAAHRGDLRTLLSGSRLKRYVLSILSGIPIYLTTGILLTFSPELSKSLGISGVTAGGALLSGTIGLTIGDVGFGLLSQLLKARKKTIRLALIGGLVFNAFYLFGVGHNIQIFYFVCFLMGLCGGYWAVLVSFIAEQFGTNLRSTATTSVPNFIRSAVIPLNLGFFMIGNRFGNLIAASFIAVLVYSTAFFALSRLDETYGKNLDFNDEGSENTDSSRTSIAN